jgi:hypothetical protein
MKELLHLRKLTKYEEQLREALQAYHDLAPALAECANECGEAVLYSTLHRANESAEAALNFYKEEA